MRLRLTILLFKIYVLLLEGSEMKISLLYLIFILFLGNCLSLGHSQGFGPSGSLYANYKVGVSGGNIAQGSKTAKSCVTKVSFLFTFGDASIEEAARDGNIKKIQTVNKEGFGILNFILFHRLCTVITGE
jgi:hypothetical protein